MAAQKGKAVLIKMDISSTFTTIGGMRSKSIRISDGNTDVSDSDGEFREMLAGTGHKSLMISGSGVFKDSAAEGQVLTNKFARATPDFQFIVPDFGTFEGPFVIGDIEYSGEHEGEVTFSMSFESAGDFTFTPA